jgi:DNA polymerase
MRNPSAARQRRPAAKADEAGGRLVGQAPLAVLEREAAGCTRCPLYQNATQTVFGEGPQDAVLVFVGEQPGDREDREGRPFVGPAGALFDRALAEAGIARSKVYVTNAVKHFKYQPRGKRRIHQKPNAGEVRACKWWLDRELAAIGPSLVVALGATAAQSLAGHAIPIMKNRGPVDFPGHAGFITVHPSSLLRVPEQDRKAEAYKAFVADLRRIRGMLKTEDAAA